METKHWDVIIVGGGMAGLLTAYLYARKQRTSSNEQQEWGELQKSQERQERNAVAMLRREAFGQSCPT